MHHRRALRALLPLLAVACGDDASDGAGSPSFSEIVIGNAGGCVVRRDDGRVLCWTGGGVTGSDASQPLTKAAVEIVAAKGAHGLAIGQEACGITAGGGVLCWTLPQGLEGGTAESESRTIALPQVTALSASVNHTCAVSAGSVWCWGANSLGQLGDGTMESSAAPVQVAGVVDAAQVTVAENSSCALTGAGKVLCWGGYAWGTQTVELSQLAGAAVIRLSDDGNVAFLCGIQEGGRISCLANTTGWDFLCRGNYRLCEESQNGGCTPAACTLDEELGSALSHPYEFTLSKPASAIATARRSLAIRFGTGRAGLPVYFIIGGAPFCPVSGETFAYDLSLDENGHCLITGKLGLVNGEEAFEGEAIFCPSMGYIENGNLTTCGATPEILLAS